MSHFSPTSERRLILLAVAAVAASSICGCAVEDAVKVAGSCGDCPIGSNKNESRKASAECGGGGELQILEESGGAKYACSGQGECQVVCEIAVPCTQGNLKISKTTSADGTIYEEFVCEQGNGCVPRCADRNCGPDGCGGTCGLLGGECSAGFECTADGQCIADCNCGPDKTECCDGCRVAAGVCLIGSKCHQDGEPFVFGYGCSFCDVAKSQVKWSRVPDNQPCPGYVHEEIGTSAECLSPVCEDGSCKWDTSLMDNQECGGGLDGCHIEWCRDGRCQREQLCIFDYQTRLFWHAPWQADHLTGHSGEELLEFGKQYCLDLVMGPYTDWRLPTIDELRTLIKGCPSTETGGDCPATVECYGKDQGECLGADCSGCPVGLGPGKEGCYWDMEFPTCRPTSWHSYMSSTRVTVGNVDSDEWGAHGILTIRFNRGQVWYTPFEEMMQYAVIPYCVRGP